MASSTSNNVCDILSNIMRQKTETKVKKGAIEADDS